MELLSVIIWLDMFLHCRTHVQEHCTVCGFSDSMVFTKTVWMKCPAVQYWPSWCMQILHGQASVLQQTSANLTGSSTGVENCIVSGSWIKTFMNYSVRLINLYVSANKQSTCPPSPSTG